MCYGGSGQLNKKRERGQNTLKCRERLLKLTVLLSLYLLGALARWTFPNDILRPEPEPVIHVRDELGYREAIRVWVVVVVDNQPVLAGAHHGLNNPRGDAGVTGKARSELDIYTAGLGVGEAQPGGWVG